jgi:hypothetical protein
MTFSDYLIDIVLVLLVVRQIRESRLSTRMMLMPLAIVAYVAHEYLHALPTAGNDLGLVAGMIGLGLALGVAGGLTTRVRTDGGRYALVRAGWVAAGLWVGSMSARLGFAIWATHGGGPALARFSAAHHLSVSVWSDAILLMALTEVVSRVGLLFWRTQRALAVQRESAPQLATV